MADRTTRDAIEPVRMHGPQPADDLAAALFAASTDLLALIHPDDSRVLNANQAWQSALGHRPETLIGSRLCDLPIYADAADLDRVATALLAPGAVAPVCASLVTSNGQQRRFEIAVRPCRVGDERRLLLTARSLPQAAADTATAALLMDALNAIGEAFVIYGPDGRLVLCNQNFRDIYGYTAEEARPGVHFQELGRIDVERGNVVVSDELGSEAYLERKAEYRRKLEGSFIVQLKDGRWLKTTDRPTSDGGFVSVQADITDMKRAAADMAAAKRDAERSSRAKSEFLAKMSHELRTPLNSILGFSEVLASPECPLDDAGKIRGYAGTIHEAGTLLLDLINDILDLSKIEAGKAELHEAAVDLDATIDGCVEMLRSQAAAGGVQLDYDRPDPAPVVRADVRYLRQVLVNILSNAVKFTRRGGRVRVDVGSDRDGGVRIVVADTGIGIASEEIARVLKPFEQIGESYRRGQDGTGLGLTIAHSLVQLHGGTLEIDSKPGRGTTVTITLPPARSLPNATPDIAAS